MSSNAIGMKPFRVLGRAIISWKKDRCGGLAAALSFFALLSFAPFIACIILLSVFFLGEQEVVSKVIPMLQARFGNGAVDLFRFLMRYVSDAKMEVTQLSLVGLVVMLGAASAYFEQLEDSLEFIWGRVHEDPGPIKMVRKKLLGMLLALVISAVFAGSLAMRIALEIPSSSIINSGSGVPESFGDMAVSFLILSTIAGIILRWFIPENLPAKKVLIGALIIGALLVVGRTIAGKVLARGELTTVTGVAGGVVVLILWIYYNSMVLLYGVEVVHQLSLEGTTGKDQKAAA